MFGFGPATRIYVATGATDMRMGFNGLYGLVRDHLGCDPESGHVFLFTNARRNRLKLLVYDHSGLWIFEKIGRRKVSLAGSRHFGHEDIILHDCFGFPLMRTNTGSGFRQFLLRRRASSASTRT